MGLHRSKPFAMLAGVLVLLLACAEPERDDPSGPLVLPEAPTGSSEPIPDFESFSDVQTKKTEFFNYVLTRVRKSNDRVWAEREFVHSFIALDKVTETQQQDFNTLVERYNLTRPSVLNESFFRALLERVDVIPASLVLAQAANESAWGTSRFARQGKNFFGIWCFVEGCGFKPKRASAESKHEVRKFTSVQQGVNFYVHNINVGHAYSDLRSLRRTLRENNEKLTGVSLAQGLVRYSERGEAYIEEIQAMIRQNKLNQYNKIRAVDSL